MYLTFINYYFRAQDAVLNFFKREVLISHPINVIDDEIVQCGHNFIFMGDKVRAVRLTDHFISFAETLDNEHLNIPLDKYVIYTDKDTIKIPVKLFIGEGYELVATNYECVETTYKWDEFIELGH